MYFQHMYAKRVKLKSKLKSKLKVLAEKLDGSEQKYEQEENNNRI